VVEGDFAEIGDCGLSTWSGSAGTEDFIANAFVDDDPVVAEEILPVDIAAVLQGDGGSHGALGQGRQEQGVADIEFEDIVPGAVEMDSLGVEEDEEFALDVRGKVVNASRAHDGPGVYGLARALVDVEHGGMVAGGEGVVQVR
jgi:hypothetical protein